jgi:23S rRNA pseudouridine1911/1915/1917 synthase
VRGIPKKSHASLVDYLLKDERTNTSSVVNAATKDAKRAELAYNVLSSSEQLSRLEIDLKTGRPHQIRVQLANIGCPLYGDQKYGATLNKPGQQLALWATNLQFDHPVTKEQMTFHSNPPQTLPWTNI